MSYYRQPVLLSGLSRLHMSKGIILLTVVDNVNEVITVHRGACNMNVGISYLEGRERERYNFRRAGDHHTAGTTM